MTSCSHIQQRKLRTQSPGLRPLSGLSWKTGKAQVWNNRHQADSMIGQRLEQQLSRKVQLKHRQQQKTCFLLSSLRFFMPFPWIAIIPEGHMDANSVPEFKKRCWYYLIFLFPLLTSLTKLFILTTSPCGPRPFGKSAGLPAFGSLRWAPAPCTSTHL